MPRLRLWKIVSGWVTRMQPIVYTWLNLLDWKVSIMLKKDLMQVEPILSCSFEPVPLRSRAKMNLSLATLMPFQFEAFAILTLWSRVSTMPFLFNAVSFEAVSLSLKPFLLDAHFEAVPMWTRFEADLLFTPCHFDAVSLWSHFFLKPFLSLCSS